MYRGSLHGGKNRGPKLIGGDNTIAGIKNPSEKRYARVALNSRHASPGTLIPHGVQRDHPVARVADVKFRCPAGRACPSPAQDALPEFMIGERAVAEIAEEPREVCRVLVGGLPLASHHWDVFFQP